MQSSELERRKESSSRAKNAPSCQLNAQRSQLRVFTDLVSSLLTARENSWTRRFLSSNFFLCGEATTSVNVHPSIAGILEAPGKLEKLHDPSLVPQNAGLVMMMAYEGIANIFGKRKDQGAEIDWSSRFTVDN